MNGRDFMDAVERKYDGDSPRECITKAVEDVWPVGVTDGGEAVYRNGEHSGLAPSFREHQKDAVVDILCNLYVADKDVVTLSAPTGAGKSLILHAVMSVVRRVIGEWSFFTTPLNALIDQVDNDDFMNQDTITMKGKNNYSCVHPDDYGTPVDKAICQRMSEFDCEYKERKHTQGGCPYYGRKKAALMHPEVVTNMSYLMANSMLPEQVETKFNPREVLVVDECQKIEDFALSFIGFTVSKRTVPVDFEKIPKPQNPDDVDAAAEWLQRDVMRPVKEKLREFDAKETLNEKEADERDRLQEFERKVRNFISDVREHHWVSEMETYGYKNDKWKVKFNPIFIGRFLEQFLWSQGEKVVLSSATIPKGDFLEEIGLDDRTVGRVEVPSTFPVERRPIYTRETVGKMTMGERDTTIPKMAGKISRMADHYEGKRGFVHCHSYGIAERIYEQLDPAVQRRTRLQDADHREESLDAWLAADVHEQGRSEDEGGQVFLSVAMDEGISLDGEKARWQVVAKAAYPFMGDKRVKYRLDELNDWNWYAGSAAIALQQAVGRGMRSKDDWCHTYILDTSAAQLIDRNEHLFEDWFLDAVGVETDVGT